MLTRSLARRMSDSRSVCANAACVCVWICIHTYIHTQIHTFSQMDRALWKHVHAYIHILTNIVPCPQARTPSHILLPVSPYIMFMYVRTHAHNANALSEHRVCMCMHIYTQICIHTRTQTHTMTISSPRARCVSLEWVVCVYRYVSCHVVLLKVCM